MQGELGGKPITVSEVYNLTIFNKFSTLYLYSGFPMLPIQLITSPNPGVKCPERHPTNDVYQDKNNHLYKNPSFPFEGCIHD